jgi:hypothetical protein
MPGELDKVADQARDLREWFSGFVRKHMGRPDSSPDTRTGIIRQLSHPKSLEADVDCEAGECPVRVISAILTVVRLLPVFPQFQTCRCTALTDAICQRRKSGALFDHLVGERQRGRGHDDAERLRGFQVDYEIELLRPLYR